MTNSIILTGSFQALLTAATGNVQVQCFNARTVFDKIQSQIANDYYALVQLFIESFDIAANIVTLNQAPLPDISDLDSRTTFNQGTWGNYAIAQQLVALSVGGNGRLVGMEGSI